MMIEERFLSEPVASQDETVFCFVPESEREHPPKFLKAVDPHLLI
jgi:hypothetical protein